MITAKETKALATTACKVDWIKLEAHITRMGKGGNSCCNYMLNHSELYRNNEVYLEIKTKLEPLGYSIHRHSFGDDERINIGW